MLVVCPQKVGRVNHSAFVCVHHDVQRLNRVDVRVYEMQLQPQRQTVHNAERHLSVHKRVD